MRWRLWVGSLGMLALFIGLLCSWTPRDRSASETGRGMLFAGIDLNAVDGVTVSNASSVVELLKQNGCWGVATANDHPVDFPKLALALRAAARLDLGEAVCVDPQDATCYGFDDEKTIRLQVAGRDVVRLDIGGSYTDGNSLGRYVKKNGSDHVYWVADDFEEFGASAERWISGAGSGI